MHAQRTYSIEKPKNHLPVPSQVQAAISASLCAGLELLIECKPMPAEHERAAKHIALCYGGRGTNLPKSWLIEAKYARIALTAFRGDGFLVLGPHADDACWPLSVAGNCKGCGWPLEPSEFPEDLPRSCCNQGCDRLSTDVSDVTQSPLYEAE